MLLPGYLLTPRLVDSGDSVHGAVRAHDGLRAAVNPRLFGGFFGPREDGMGMGLRIAPSLVAARNRAS